MNVSRRTPWLAFATVATALLLVVGAGAAPARAAGFASQPTPSWVPNGRVYSIVSDGQRVYVGGTFTRLRNPATGESVTRSRLAAFDANTGELDLSWNPGADDTVRALATGPDGILYVGGAFLNVGGASATRVAALQPDGSLVAGFASAPNGTVRDLLYDAPSASLFVAGTFGSVDGRHRVGVAKVDPYSGALAQWNARIGSGRVVALVTDPARGALVVGGNFKTLAGQPMPYLASVQISDASATGWTPPVICDSCNVLDLARAGDSIYAAAAGGGGGRAAAWSSATSQRLWVRRGDGDVQAIAYHDGVVYAGGHFGMDFDGVERHQLAAMNADTGSVLDYRVDFTGNDEPGIWALQVDEANLRIGGGFQGISGSSAARYAVLPASSSEGSVAPVG